MTKTEMLKLLEETAAASKSFERIIPVGQKLFDVMSEEELNTEESFCAALGLAHALLVAAGGTSYMMRAGLISFFNAVDQVEELTCLPTETTPH